MAKIPSDDPRIKVTKTLPQEVLQAWLVASEREQGYEIVPGSFKWVHGWRPEPVEGGGTHNTNTFGGVSYEVTPIVLSDLV